MTDATAPFVFTDNPLNPLEVALYEGLADPSKMGLFERLMLEADLYAVPEAGSVGGVHGDDGHKVLREGEQLVLRGVVLNDGRDTVTLFTDPRRAVGMFGEDTRILAMKGRALLSMLQNSLVLLNPDGGRGIVLAPEQLKAVLEHAPAPAPLRPTGAVQLYPVVTGQEPVVLIDRLKTAFAGYPVDSAWLARAAWASDNRVGWYLDVRTDRPSDEVVAILNRAVTGLSFGQEVFDVAVGRTNEDGVGVKVV
ncbi:SseB family protein [Brevundimonas sp. GCM10030266]|uniref:SseB family protein n=1 Tax=Brevundimonas sp. GCM10030266 TaxID=3273386 RepID=UPI00361064FB